jgi:hypothetical protein
MIEAGADGTLPQVSRAVTPARPFRIPVAPSSVST